MAFLSLLDERMRAKGSRDPLGFETVWTAFGRRLVGNLTTVTGSWRNFAVALLGFHWAHALARDTREGTDKRQALQEYFIRYEQLAAYLRCIGDDPSGDVLGVTRARKHLRDASERVRLGVSTDRLILSDQLSYGLWGLYSSAMRATDLVQGDDRELTTRGQEIAESIAAHLDAGAFLDYMRGGRDELSLAELAVLKRSFVTAITQPSVKTDLIHALLAGPAEPSLQRALFDATQQIALSTRGLDTASYIAALQETSLTHGLRQQLAEIEALERLLVAANLLFDYCRRKDGASLDEIVENLAQDEQGYALDFSYISPEPRLDAFRYGRNLHAIRAGLRSNDLRAALISIFDLNRRVMSDRGGAPWVELANDEQLRVRINSETSDRPTLKKLQQAWHYTYFLDSFARISSAYPA